MPATKILAASEGIDLAKEIAARYSDLLNMNIRVHLLVDSKDSFTTSSTKRNYIDRSSRGDVDAIPFEFVTGTVNKISWIPGQRNLADVFTKLDSPLTEFLELALFTSRLPIDLEKVKELKSSNKEYG